MTDSDSKISIKLKLQVKSIWEHWLKSDLTNGLLKRNLDNECMNSFVLFLLLFLPQSDAAGYGDRSVGSRPA